MKVQEILELMKSETLIAEDWKKYLPYIETLLILAEKIVKASGLTQVALILEEIEKALEALEKL